MSDTVERFSAHLTQAQRLARAKRFLARVTAWSKVHNGCGLCGDAIGRHLRFVVCVQHEALAEALAQYVRKISQGNVHRA